MRGMTILFMGSVLMACGRGHEADETADAQAGVQSAESELTGDPIAELASKARVAAVFDGKEKHVLPESIAFVPSSQPSHLRRDKDGIHPQFASLPETVLARRPELTMSESAAAPIVVRNGDVSLAVKRVGVREGHATTGATGIRYDDAVEGGILYTIPLYEGVEDFVSFAHAPAKSELRYALDVQHAAGLRLVEGVLEVLDAKGDPRLRVPPPRVLDAQSVSHPMTMAVEGCAIDSDPRAPWDRPPTAPGAATCELVLRWDEHLAYPIVVDPAITTTGSPITPRSSAVAVPLTPTTNIVVITAGHNTAGSALAATELFNSTTNTFTATGALATARTRCPGTWLPSNRAVVSGGANAATSENSIETLEVYNYATGAWTAPFPAMPSRPLACAPSFVGGWRHDHAMANVGGNWLGSAASSVIMIAGGRDNSGSCTNYWDQVAWMNTAAASPSWVIAPALPSPRYGSVITANNPLDANIGVVGGRNSGGTVLDDSVTYFVGSGNLSQLATVAHMVSPRSADLGATAINDRVNDRSYVAGGDYPAAGSTSSTIEEINAKVGGFGKVFTTATLDTNRPVGGAALGPYGVFVYGTQFATVNLQPWIWAPVGGVTTTFKGGAMSAARTLRSIGAAQRGPEFIALADGSVLAFGPDNVTTAERWSRSPNGATCPSVVNDCLSGICTDGVCCNTTCTGTCQACNVSGSAGTCTNVGVGVADPDSCAPTTTSTCDGAGNCKVKTGQSCDATTKCLTGNCVDGFCCDKPCSGACDFCAASLGASANGTCTNVAGSAGSPSCGGFLCKATSPSCPTGCATDADCSAAQYCNAAGACVARKALGAACNQATDCKSGACHVCTSDNCVDGVCCNEACNGLCRRCSAALKASGTDDGVCDSAKEGQPDRAGACIDSGTTGATACKTNGVCNGTGGCELYSKTTSCGGSGSTCVGNKASGRFCDGVGNCLAAGAAMDCAPYVCKDGIGCPAACTSNTDCTTDAYCDPTNHCKTKSTNGTACVDKGECASNICVDGVCCNAPCGGQCEACDVKGGEGTCVPVSDKPHGSRDACSSGTADNVCSEARCDGTERASCLGFVGATKSCRTASCSAGVATFAASCDGKGACPAVETKNCEPFACDTTACKTSCTTATDCAPNYRCDTSGKCVTQSTCDGDHTITAADGVTKSDCAPYKCDSSGTCKTACATTDDCVSPGICSGGTCNPPPAAEDASGCGCAVPGSSSSSGRLALAGLVALVLAGRRRRPRA